MRPPLKITTGATVLAAILSGCGLTDNDSEAGEQNDGSESGSAPDHEEVIAEETFPYQDTEVTVEINGLSERDDLLQLNYTLTYGSPDSGNDSSSLNRALDADWGGNLYLVDTENLRRHTVVEPESGDPLEPHPWDTELSPGEPAPLTAFFASAKDMAAVDVYLYDFPPIMDVPVTKDEDE